MHDFGGEWFSETRTGFPLAAEMCFVVAIQKCDWNDKIIFFLLKPAPLKQPVVSYTLN